MLNATPAEQEVIKSILKTLVPSRKVAVFGSRANGTPKPYSDIDLAIYGSEPLPISTLCELREAFSESDLPYRVDIVDMTTVADDFRAVIEANKITIQE